MEIRICTIELNSPRWLRKALVYGALPAGTLFGAVSAVHAAATLTTFKSGTVIKAADVNANFKTLGDSVAALEQKPSVVVASSHNTGTVGPNAEDWTAIPGLSVSFSLAAASSVQMFGNGVQRTVDNLAGTLCHGQYRFVLDGTPQGDSDGQRIQVSAGSVGWHTTWNLVDSTALDAGAHTISLETKHPGANGGACYVCGELDGEVQAHDGCALNVIAVPE